MKKTYTVIDSSGYSMLDFDYNALKNSGVDGVILRAGYGCSADQRDPAFEEAYQRAEAAGVLIGAYWFDYFRSIEDAIAEAEAFNEVIKGKSFPLGIYFDYEEATIQYMDKCGASKDDMTGRLVAAIEHMISLGWEKVRWYTNTHCLRGCYGADALDISRLQPYGFWHACFDGTADNETEFDGLTVVGEQYANNVMKPSELEWLPNVDVSAFYLDDIEEDTDETAPGSWSREQAEGVVRGLYSRLLRRGYGNGENEGLIQGLMGDMTRADAFWSVVSSEEFTKKAVIMQCYLFMRGSLPSDEEVESWFGLDVVDIVSGILYSDEFNGRYGV
jgi:GH25 family lysozyme M1 (1,4-beta-N-acetylmuramidase)